jgi:putative FmdB family regulatory protein
MPTYEYKCDACGHAFEKFQQMSAAPIKKCPKCGKSKVRRLIGTGAGLIFKGSGFYITDYRDKSYADSAKADGGASGNGEAKTDSKSDSKSETKSETKSQSKSETNSAEPTTKKSEPKPAQSPSKSESKSKKK